MKSSRWKNFQREFDNVCTEIPKTEKPKNLAACLPYLSLKVDARGFSSNSGLVKQLDILKVYASKRIINIEPKTRLSALYRKKQLELLDFIECDAWAVSSLIAILVTRVEQHFTENPDDCSSVYTQLTKPPKTLLVHTSEVLVKVLDAIDKRQAFSQWIDREPVAVCGAMIFLFLASLRNRPLRLLHHCLVELTHAPLYDMYSRPNENLRRIIRKTLSKESQSEVDTFAYLMLHMNNITELSNGEPLMKTVLCNLFAPLLVNLEDRVVATHLKPNSNTCIESLILEAAHLICDQQFWHYVANNQLQRMQQYFTLRTSEKVQELKTIFMECLNEQDHSNLGFSSQSATKTVPTDGAPELQKDPRFVVGLANDQCAFQTVLPSPTRSYLDKSMHYYRCGQLQKLRQHQASFDELMLGEGGKRKQQQLSSSSNVSLPSVMLNTLKFNTEESNKSSSDDRNSSSDP